MSEPLQHPAVWRGTELLSRPDWRHELTGEEVAAIRALQFAPESSTESITLPTSLIRKLTTIQHDLENGSGAVVLKGFPVADLSESHARNVFLALARHVGSPISQSAAGEIVFSVRDEGFAENDPRARGPNTRKKLSFHTDRCDVISFLCLKQARAGGDNEIVSSMALYNEILRRRPDMLKELMKPYYYQRHNVDLGNEKPYCEQPVFSFQEGHFAGSFLRVLIERAYQNNDIGPMPDTKREALDTLESIAGDPALNVHFRQEPGDILFLNNWVTFHRRTGFEDYPDLERKRHILRIWLSTPNSRPLDPLFKDNFGATEAGVLRGGMRKAQT